MNPLAWCESGLRVPPLNSGRQVYHNAAPRIMPHRRHLPYGWAPFDRYNISARGGQRASLCKRQLKASGALAEIGSAAAGRRTTCPRLGSGDQRTQSRSWMRTGWRPCRPLCACIRHSAEAGGLLEPDMWATQPGDGLSGLASIARPGPSSPPPPSSYRS